MIQFNTSTHRWEVVWNNKVLATASFEIPDEDLEKLRLYVLRQAGVIRR